MKVLITHLSIKWSSRAAKHVPRKSCLFRRIGCDAGDTGSLRSTLSEKNKTPVKGGR